MRANVLQCTHVRMETLILYQWNLARQYLNNLLHHVFLLLQPTEIHVSAIIVVKKVISSNNALNSNVRIRVSMPTWHSLNEEWVSSLHVALRMPSQLIRNSRIFLFLLQLVQKTDFCRAQLFFNQPGWNYSAVSFIRSQWNRAWCRTLIFSGFRCYK